MGALLIKADCTGCCERRNKGKVAPVVPVICPAKEVINELERMGLIVTNNAGTAMGLSYEIFPDGRITQRRPRRLSSLQRRDNRVNPTTDEVARNIREQSLKADSRRQDQLFGKGKYGRSFYERRQAVLNRREEKLQQKLKRTEEKMKKLTSTKQKMGSAS